MTHLSHQEISSRIADASISVSHDAIAERAAGVTPLSFPGQEPSAVTQTMAKLSAAGPAVAAPAVVAPAANASIGSLVSSGPSGMD